MPKKHARFLTRKRVLLGVTLVAVVTALLAGSTVLYQEQTKNAELIDEETLARYEKRDDSGLESLRLTRGVMPPTNKWYSQLALQDNNQPVVAYPNSYKVRDNGLEVSLPEVEVQPDAVEARHREGAKLTIESAKSYKITRFDQLSVDVTFYDDQQRELAVTTLMAGVPIVPVVAKRAIKVEMEVERALVLQNQGVGGSKDQWFGLQQADGRPKLENERLSAKLKEGQFVSAYTAPSRDDLDAVAASALNRPMNATVEYRHSTRRATTEISVRTANNQPTAVALMPHQQSDEYATIAEYPSPFGPLKLVQLRTLRYTVPPVAATGTLSLARVSEQDKESIIAQLQADVAETKLDGTDPDTGGKQLQRAAELLNLARELDQPESIQVLKQKLNRAFDDWLSPTSARGFYYDTRLQSMVGKQASSSQRQLDRHHAVYGYYLYAASALGAVDSTFTEQHAKEVNLLAADIAGYKELDLMPARRYFDPYHGHSWDVGVPSGGYGNRQVSSAEAINAWNGLALWAEITQNDRLEEQALWLLANEAASAKRYQTNIAIAGYDHANFGTIWGARREWQTAGYETINAPVGLQLSPMAPALAAIYRGEDELLGRLLEQPELNMSLRYADSLLLAGSLADPAKAQERLMSAPIQIESSTSKTYLMAFVAAEVVKRK